MLEGVISILEGMNPRMIETKLRTYLFESHPPKDGKSGKNAEARA
jgi:chemotaxis protein MotA